MTEFGIDEYRAKAGRMWSGTTYAGYRNAPWTWKSLPFVNDPTRPRRTAPILFRDPRSLIGKAPAFRSPWMEPPVSRVAASSILEVGSAMGQGYRFLAESALVDLGGYVGADISVDGQKHCRETYPNATWVEADFTRYDLPQRFEYAYERHAIHHMPEPIAQFSKVLGAVDRAASFAFFGRVEGDTVSDLDRSYFVQHTEHPDGSVVAGRYFANMINVWEVLRLARDNGFNHIGLLVFGHEKIPTREDEMTPSNNQVTLAEVQASGGQVLTFGLYVAKVPELTAPLVYAVTADRSVRIGRAFRVLRRGLSAVR